VWRIYFSGFKLASMTHSVKLLLPLLPFFFFLQCGHSQASADRDQLAAAGRRALDAGHFAEAESAYEKLQQLEPGSPEVYVALGLIYFQEGKYDRAVPALTRALRLKANPSKTDALLAMSLSELGRFREALPGLEKCFHQAPDAEVKRMCGLQLERTDTGLQRDAKAVDVALEMDRLYPDDPEVLYHSGRLYGNLAFVTVQRLAAVAPNSIWKQQAAAEAFESQGDFQAAIDAYHAVLSIDPQRAGIHYRIGRTLLNHSRQSNSPDEINAAQKEFEQELAINPSNGNAAYELGEIHRTTGRMDEAARYFEIALKQYPGFEEAHLGLSAVLMAQQKPLEAVPHLKEAIHLNPTNEVAWYRLSRTEGMLGNQAEQNQALAEFKRLRNAQASEKQRVQKIMNSSEEVTPQRLDN
jgi:tetratricopeptide (TPR) repeat protein